MTGKIGLKEDEYLELADQLKKVHTSSIEAVNDALGSIEKLNSIGGGFYTKETTPRISALVQEVRSILSILEEAYAVHEEIINSFQNTIANYDTFK